MVENKRKNLAVNNDSKSYNQFVHNVNFIGLPSSIQWKTDTDDRIVYHMVHNYTHTSGTLYTHRTHLYIIVNLEQLQFGLSFSLVIINKGHDRLDFV